MLVEFKNNILHIFMFEQTKFSWQHSWLSKMSFMVLVGNHVAKFATIARVDKIGLNTRALVLSTSLLVSFRER